MTNLEAMEALDLETLFSMSEEAAASQGVPLAPVTDVWRLMVKNGLMSEQEAKNAFIQILMEQIGS